MNIELAENILYRLDSLEQFGARSGRVASQIKRQLSSISGQLEI